MTGSHRSANPSAPSATRPSTSRAPHRIAIIGSGRPGALAHSVVRGFEALGKEPHLIPYMDWSPRLRTAFRGAGALNLGLAAATRPALEARLVVELSRLSPDLVVFLKCDDLHAATYKALRRVLPGVPLIAYHPDDPWNRGTARSPGPAHARALMQLGAVDAAFLWSRDLTARAARETAAKRVFYLPFACDPTLHPHLTDLSEEERKTLGAPVCFIGNWDEERERWLAPLAEAGLGLAIWGTTYWKTRTRHPALQAAYRGRPLVGREQAAAALSSDVLVNVLRRQNKGACNMRTFEIPCVGAFMLHERSDEAAAFFPPGIACDDFATPEELVEVVKRVLADPERRQRLAAEGHRRALQWTYREWCAAMLERLEGWAF
jgi:hypothetical protein